MKELPEPIQIHQLSVFVIFSSLIRIFSLTFYHTNMTYPNSSYDCLWGVLFATWELHGRGLGVFVEREM